MSKPKNVRGFPCSTHFVHARRARKLRRNGVDVRFWGWSHGHTVWVWFKKR